MEQTRKMSLVRQCYGVHGPGRLANGQLRLANGAVPVTPVNVVDIVVCYVKSDKKDHLKFYFSI